MTLVFRTDQDAAAAEFAGIADALSGTIPAPFLERLVAAFGGGQPLLSVWRETHSGGDVVIVRPSAFLRRIRHAIERRDFDLSVFDGGSA